MLKNKYITDQNGSKYEVIKTTTHSSNSYEIRSTKPNKNGYIFLEIVAINNTQGNIKERVERIHIDDFVENYEQ